MPLLFLLSCPTITPGTPSIRLRLMVKITIVDNSNVMTVLQIKSVIPNLAISALTTFKGLSNLYASSHYFIFMLNYTFLARVTFIILIA